SGSMKNMRRPATGSLSRAMNRPTPMSTVMSSAMRGEAKVSAFEGTGRGSSLNMRALLCGGCGRVPQAAQPGADLFDGGFGHRQAGRKAALRHHHQAVTDFKQFVQLLADDQHGAAGIAQLQQLAPDLGGGAHVHAPGGL